jgi:hypothetical protein
MKVPKVFEDFLMLAAHLEANKTGCLAKRLPERSRSWTTGDGEGARDGP